VSTSTEPRPDTGSLPAAPAPDKKLAPNEIVTIVVLLFSTFVAFLSEMVVGVALPTIMSDLDISATSGQWLTTGYALTLAVVIPTTGYVLKRFRLRPIYITSMGLFTLGTAIAATAPGFELLLAGRIVQAVGTGVLVPLLMTTAFGLVAPSRRGQIMALITAVSAVAPALGPAFSGLVMAQLTWRWLFIIVLPVALLALIIGSLKIPNLTEPRRISFDLLSLGLSVIGFGALVYGLSAAGEGSGGEIPAAFWIALPLGLVGIAGFVLRQILLQRRHAAVMDMRIFARRDFTTSTILFAFIVAGAFSLSVLLPLVLQESLGLGVFETGLLMVPGGVTIGIVSLIVGRLYDRVGPRTLMIPGTVLVAAGWWFMTTFDQATPAWMVVVTFIVICAGQCFAWVPIFTLALGSLPDHLHAHGSAALNTVQQLGGAAGLAALVAILSANTLGEGPAAIAGGAQAAFTGGGVIALGALAAALFIPRRKR
jgi:DHA2 family lincomycin resistance protein-like MFS transporter